MTSETSWLVLGYVPGVSEKGGYLHFEANGVQVKVIHVISPPGLLGRACLFPFSPSKSRSIHPPAGQLNRDSTKPLRVCDMRTDKRNSPASCV